MALRRLFLLALLLLAVSSSISYVSAYWIPTDPLNTGQHVCNPARYQERGLDMNDFVFCNKSLPYSVRVKDLVDRMTMTEKALQLGDEAFGVPRLGLLPYEWWSEALHGVSNVGPGTRFDLDVVPGATTFPTPVFTTASFNESLWKNIGQVVSTEARAMFNLGLGGLTYWSPNINLARDPRWGRILETPGEDPYVVGRYAVNYVRGLQDVEGHEEDEDPNSRPLKVSSCCKHSAAYDLDGWLAVDRNHFDARVSNQDMVESFLRPFEMCVREGDVSSVMCSFNKINGVPACTDNRLLSEKYRGEWNLHGYIVADCDSLDIIIKYNKWLDDSYIDAVSQALEAGMDLDCGLYYTKNAVTAVGKGRVKEEEVDKALKNLYTVLMRVGFFDGSSEYDHLGKEDICSEEHIELAAQAAREGMVLLKNDGTLPLMNMKRIALVGPHANATEAMIGNYAGIPCKYVSPLDALSETAINIDYQPGCLDVVCNSTALFQNAKEAAKQGDATVIFAGIDLSQEREWVDRVEITLPGNQTQLINEVAASAAGPVVLVLLNGGVLDVSFAQQNPKISAIVWAGYPGEQGGNAIADVILGKYNPGGRLPLTWYHADYIEKLPMTSMQFRPDDELGYPGRTYKFFNGSVLYPFGHGLSYTTFAYSITNVSSKKFVTKLNRFQHCKSMNYTDPSIVQKCPAMRIDDLSCDDHYSLDFQVEVSNTGKRDGDHVVMVYSTAPAGMEDAPFKQVVGFQRVAVPASGKTTAKFSLNVCKSFSVVTKSGYVVLPSGEHRVMIGGGDEAVSFPVQIDFE